MRLADRNETDAHPEGPPPRLSGCAAALLLLGPTAAAAPGAAAGGWTQDRFVISMCNDPIVAPDQLAFRYNEMAEANFTLVSSTAWLSIGAHWDVVTRMEHAQTSLRAAEAAGLALMGEVMTPGYDNATDDIHANSSLLSSNSSALWGWLLADEPSPRSQFYALRRARAQIDAHRPGKLVFVNLLPNYAFPRPQLGWDTYEEYLDFFIAEYKPQVLCFDRKTPLLHFLDFGAVRRPPGKHCHRRLPLVRGRRLCALQPAQLGLPSEHPGRLPPEFGGRAVPGAGERHPLLGKCSSLCVERCCARAGV